MMEWTFILKHCDESDSFFPETPRKAHSVYFLNFVCMTTSDLQEYSYLSQHSMTGPLIIISKSNSGLAWKILDNLTLL